MLAGCAFSLGEDYTVTRNEESRRVYIVDYNLDAYVPIPRIGEAPVVHLDNLEDLEVKVLWKDAGGEPLPSFAAFEAGTIYQAEIQLTPKPGYEFYSSQLFTYRGDKIKKQQDDGGAAVRIITVTYKALLDPNTLDPAGDEDKDGFSNGYEMAEGTDPADPTSHPGNVISEESLLEFLGVTTVAEAIEGLHQWLNNAGSGGPYFDGLKLGMYLDLPSLNVGGFAITDDGKQNLRIVIASFNQYKNEDNPKDHIKFVFKNIPVQKQMRTVDINDEGYPRSYGNMVLKPYLEGPFLRGLKEALGTVYVYRVARNITGGRYGAWTTELFDAEIFIDTEKEVWGYNQYGNGASEGDLVQTALYAQGGADWRLKKDDGVGSTWWLASPVSDQTEYFCCLISTDSPLYGYFKTTVVAGVAPAFCIY
jgi:hypothetical protein